MTNYHFSAGDRVVVMAYGPKCYAKVVKRTAEGVEVAYETGFQELHHPATLKPLVEAMTKQQLELEIAAGIQRWFQTDGVKPQSEIWAEERFREVEIELAKRTDVSGKIKL